MPPEAGERAHFNRLVSLYRGAPINALFRSEIEIPEAGVARAAHEGKDDGERERAGEGAERQHQRHRQAAPLFRRDGPCRTPSAVLDETV